MLESRGRDTAALVSVDIATKKAKVLAEDPRADAATCSSTRPSTPCRRSRSSTSARSGRCSTSRSRPTLAALAKLDGGEPHITSRTLDDKTWLVVTSSEQRPGRYYLWNRAKQKGTFLFSNQPALEEQPLVKMHPTVVPARDGLPLVSYLTLPAAADPDGDGKANQPVPLVLLVHGGPWARDAWGYNPLHQLLANRGYAVLSVNFRGSTGFGKKFLNAGNREWAKKMHDDLLDAVAWAVDQGVAPARTGSASWAAATAATRRSSGSR